MNTDHPARYNKKIVQIAADLIPPETKILLDPFSGTGERIALLRDYGYEGEIICNEIEFHWARQAPLDKLFQIVGDATRLPLLDESVDTVFSSPTYGNRMGDSHTPSAKDTSTRNTYTHRMMALAGTKLHARNTGHMNWGKKYREFHRLAWKETVRTLKSGGTFILNIKDFLKTNVVSGVKAQRRVFVTRFHVATLNGLGLRTVDHIKLNLSGNRHGANHRARIPYTNIIVFKK